MPPRLPFLRPPQYLVSPATCCTSVQQCIQHPYSSPLRSLDVRTYGSKTPPVRVPSDRPVLDEAIQAQRVQYVDDKGAFHGTHSLQHLLRRINRQTHHIQCVNPTADPDALICKLISKEDLKAQLEQKYREKRNKKKDPSAVQKEIELSWAISEHDLDHRMKKVQQFLEKGNKVEITIGTKRGMKKQPVSVMKELIERLEERIGQWGKESQEPEGVIGKKWMMYYEALKKPGPSQRSEQRPTQELEQQQPVQQSEQRPAQELEPQRPVQQSEQRSVQQSEQRPVQQSEQRPAQESKPKPPKEKDEWAALNALFR